MEEAINDSGKGVNGNLYYIGMCFTLFCFTDVGFFYK